MHGPAEAIKMQLRTIKWSQRAPFFYYKYLINNSHIKFQNVFAHKGTMSYLCRGEMAERSNAAVLKTVEGNTSGGSNPSLSARCWKRNPKKS